MSDLVERFRRGEPCDDRKCRVMEAASGCMCAEAADEIERLERLVGTMLHAQHGLEIEQLRPSVREMRRVASYLGYVMGLHSASGKLLAQASRLEVHEVEEPK